MSHRQMTRSRNCPGRNVIRAPVYIESFNARVGDKCLNVNSFWSTDSRWRGALIEVSSDDTGLLTGNPGTCRFWNCSR